MLSTGWDNLPDPGFPTIWNFQLLSKGVVAAQAHGVHPKLAQPHRSGRDSGVCAAIPHMSQEILKIPGSV